jgi:hypothetical protein
MHVVAEYNIIVMSFFFCENLKICKNIVCSTSMIIIIV